MIEILNDLAHIALGSGLGVIFAGAAVYAQKVYATAVAEQQAEQVESSNKTVQDDEHTESLAGHDNWSETADWVSAASSRSTT